MWLWFAGLAGLLLPFGIKRIFCDHQSPSLRNSMRSLFGIRTTCHLGSCILAPSPWDRVCDDFAWSIYVLDLMVWSYVYVLTVYATVCLAWFVSVWAILVIVAIVTCVGGCCMLLGEGGCEQAGSCDCHSWDCFHHDIGSSAEGTELFRTETIATGAAPHDLFWGPQAPLPAGHPLSPGPCYLDCSGMYSSGSHDPCCCGGCFRCCCGPCNFVITHLMPSMPSNMWGGLVGKWLGTHIDTPAESSYSGGSPLVDFLGMAWRRRGDLRGDGLWHGQVAAYIQMRRSTSESISQAPIVNIGRSGTYARRIGRRFNISQDRCVPSSFQDYQQGSCWICRDTHSEWDMWITCRHMFCARCSTEMLQRLMPCPMCRVASTSALRGSAFSG